MSSIVPDLKLPLVTVDEAHWQKVHANAAEALEYSIPLKEGFQISTSGFSFVIPDGMDFKAPNIIQIVIGKEELYAMAYEQGLTLYTCDKANLVPMYGSRPFEGFRSGTKLILAIGHLSPPSSELPQPKFTVLWAGVVNIL
ncbi:MAG: hypothetical protein CVU42_17805 [Chloroflexi bacterium HGW-Chloroflexi-4]|jgi:hypothetical protein|nr:MAG: hypothetical protein CVU42_17805 [Chloroflexi bacterium HGW-Chloroflexi-4]